MGRKPNTGVRREQIVEALLQEMSSVGYERASTRSIAARAGLTPGLVYYHFKSKEDILLALVDELILSAERRFSEALESADSTQSQLAAYVSSRVGLGANSDRAQVRTWVCVLAEAMGQAGVRARIAKWLGSDRARLSKMLEQAGLADPAEAASLLIAMILGSFSLHALQVAGVPKGYAERQIFRWLEGLARR